MNFYEKILKIVDKNGGYITTKELVKNDIIDFVVCQQPYNQGYQVIKKLHEYLNKVGNTTACDYIVEPVIKVKTHFD